MGFLERSTLSKIERYFYIYDKIKRAVELRKEELIKGGKSFTYDEIQTQPNNRTSDPVGIRGAELAYISHVRLEDNQVITDPEKWIVVIENTRAKFKNDLRGELIEMRYIQKRRVGYIYIEMRISERTFFDWREDILSYAAFHCYRFDLLKIKKDGEAVA